MIYIIAIVLFFSTTVEASDLKMKQLRIWLTPFAPVTPAASNRRGSSDYFESFQLPEQWPKSRQAASIFKVYRDQIDVMSDDQIKAIYYGSRKAGLQLAMETSVLLETSACGPGSHKFPSIGKVIQRFKALDINLSYIAMNEPLAGGLSDKSPTSCHATVTQIAEDVAGTIQEVKKYFPEIKIGDIEPIGRFEQIDQTWVGNIDKFVTILRQKFGTQLDFMHADIVWGRSWRDDLSDLQRVAIREKMRFGVIVNGDFSEMTDQAWSDNSVFFFQEVLKRLESPIDDVIIQSWDTFPTKIIPEIDNSTFSGIVNRVLTLERRFEKIGDERFRLVTQDLAPIPDTIVQTERRTERAERQSRILVQGIVPANAVKALVGFRLNSECSCRPTSGKADFKNLLYLEEGRTPLEKHSDAVLLSALANARNKDVNSDILSIEFTEKMSIIANSAVFSVNSGQKFEIRGEMWSNIDFDEAAKLVIVFTDDQNREIRRSYSRISPVWIGVERVITDKDGSFSISKKKSFPNRWRMRSGDRVENY